MALILIQHPVASFEAWKKAFESDPLGRRQNAVTGHLICRAADDPNFVVVTLEFASREQAEKVLPRLQQMWQNVGGKLGFGDAAGVQARILDEVERVEY